LTELPRIRTPLKQQWQRVRYQLLPVLSLACCAFLTAWLWSRRIEAITTFGEVQVTHLNVITPFSGTLVAFEGEPKLFDYVAEAQVVARLDDAHVRAMMAVIQEAIAALRLDLPAKREELRIAEGERQQAEVTAARRMAFDVEDMKLRVLDRKAQIAADTIALARLNTLYEAVKQLSIDGAASQRELLDIQLQKDVMAERIKMGGTSLAEAERNLEAATKRLGSMPSQQSAAVDTILAPIHARILEQQAKLEELEVGRKALEIKTPMSGYVTSVHRKAGQAVHAGDDIMTLVDDRSRHIISYIRQDQRIHPSMSMTVEIRSRIDGGKPVAATVANIGVNYEQIPVHQARDPRITEWGIPVLINLPVGMNLRPGELVEVRIRPPDMAAP